MVALLRTKAVASAPVSGGPYLLQLIWQPGTGGGSVADATDTLARFRAMWFAMSSAITTSTTIVFNPVVDVFDSATGELTGAWTGTPPANVGGTAGGNPLPAQVQGLIRWTTPIVRRGRFLKGRTYVPLPEENANSATGTPGAPYITLLNGGVAAALAAGSTASTLQIWGRPTTPGGSDGVAGPVNGGSAAPTWATQRRRAI